VGGLVKLSFSLDGEKVVHARLGVAAEVIGDMTPTWDNAAGPWLREHMAKQFDSEGAHGGKSWADYSAEPKYAAFKRAIVGHLDLLRWQKGGPFERLYPSLTKRFDPFSIFIARKDELTFGTKVPYAKRLTKGGVGPFGERYKGRAIIAMTNNQRRDFIRTIQRDMVARVSRQTLRAARV